MVALRGKTLLTLLIFVLATAASFVTSQESGVCNGLTEVSGQSGTITDGSGDESYQGAMNCTWVISPDSPTGTVTVMFTDFRTVLGADTLYFADGTDTNFTVTGGSVMYGNPLAFYSGQIPLPLVVKFDADELRVQFITYGSSTDSREPGFTFDWWVDGTCANDCSGNGECTEGLCICAEDFTGGDCSLDLPTITPRGTDDADNAQEGTVGVGDIDYYKFTVPDDGNDYYIRVDMENLGDPSSSDPMLLLLNATVDEQWMKWYYSTAPTGPESVGPCGPAPGCHWCESCTQGIDDPNISELLNIAGPTTDYYTNAFGVDNAYPDPTNIRLPSLPTQSWHTFQDYESWDLRQSLHSIFLSNSAADKTVVTPGEWIIGVYNSPETKLADFLGSNTRFWGTDAGFTGATEAAQYRLSLAVTSDINSTCPLGCSGNGVCVNGACVCDITESTHFAGEACEIFAAVLPPDLTLQAEPLKIGQWAYFYVPLTAENYDDSFFAEIVHPGSPSLVPFLFVNKDSNGIPTEKVFCGNYWGSGPYGAVHCEITGYNADAEAVDNPFDTVGIDYQVVSLSQEANSLSDGAFENGFYIGVYNHPSYGEDVLLYSVGSKFLAEGSAAPCPLDCSGQGECTPPISDDAVGVCVCDEGYVGPFCADTSETLTPGETVTSLLKSGDWAYYTFTPESDGNALVEMTKVEANTKPFIFVKEGNAPVSTRGVYSSEEKIVVVNLDPTTSGLSIDTFSKPGEPGYEGNIVFNFTGSIPPRARVTGLSFDELTLTTIGTSWASEAGLVFFTEGRPNPPVYFADVFNPTPEGIFLDGAGPAINFPLVVPDDGVLFAELGEDLDDVAGQVDATLNGTLIIRYVEELFRGFDYEDATSAYCSLGDCAIDFYHEVDFPVEAGKTYFVGVLNANHITSTPLVDKTVGGQERFKEDMNYSIKLTLGDEDSPLNIPCYQDCNMRGQCVAESAPLCECDEGYFGIGCEIDPETLPVGTSEEDVTVLTGTVNEGSFKYFKLDLPANARSLRITMTKPREEDSSPVLLAKKGSLPKLCLSLQGLSQAGCTDDYDFAAFDLNPRKVTFDSETYDILITPNEKVALNATKEFGEDAAGVWYVGIYADTTGATQDVTYAIDAFQTSELECVVSDCSGAGICDTSVGLCKCIETDGLRYAKSDCSAPIYVAEDGVPLDIPGPIRPGAYAYVEVDVACEGQDLILEASRPLDDSGAQFSLLLPPRGTEPDVDDALDYLVTEDRDGLIPGYNAIQTTWASYGDGRIEEGEATVNNIAPGKWTIGIYNVIDSADSLRNMTFTARLRGSQMPTQYNACQYSDEHLNLAVSSNFTDLVAEGPIMGSTRDSFGINLGENYGCAIREAIFTQNGVCGTSEKSCLFGSQHTTYPSETLSWPAGQVGHNNVTGLFAFGISAPTAVNADYYISRDGPLKVPGIADEDNVPASDVLYQAISGEEQFDYEACSALVNPEEIAGKICVVVRGGCNFSLKLKNCQAAGAIAVVIVNSKVGQCALNMVGSHPGDELLIPTISMSYSLGLRIYQDALNGIESDSLGLSAPNVGNEVAGAFSVAECVAPSECPECGRGRYNAPDGEGDCKGFSCPGLSADGTSVCSGTGECVINEDSATCSCDPGFTGDDCSSTLTECSEQCTACKQCVEGFCFTADCPFCASDLDSLDSWEEGMLTECTSACDTCFEGTSFEVRA